MSVEDAELFMQKQETYYEEEQLLNDILNRAYNEMPFVIDLVNNYYGSNYNFMIKELSFYEDELERNSESISKWNSYNASVQEDIDQRTELMRSRLESGPHDLGNNVSEENMIPGFNSMFTIASLFILTILLKRNI